MKKTKKYFSIKSTRSKVAGFNVSEIEMGNIEKYCTRHKLKKAKFLRDAVNNTYPKLLED